MITQRYQRQEAISGWEQQKLKKGTVTIIGDSLLSDLLVVDMLSLGIGRIYRIGRSDMFPFKKINPSVYLEQSEECLTDLDQARLLINEGIVVDATNSLESKALSSSAAKDNGLSYISGGATQDRCSFCSFDGDVDICDFHASQQGLPQGIVYSMICSACISDEIRKKLMPQKEEYGLDRFEYQGIRERPLSQKVLQIGAGAIGTFSALALSFLEADVCIVDYDRVEETNYNRQFLFFDCIGKNKAEMLSQRLQKYSKKVRGIDGKVSEGFHPESCDILFSCVDNNLARYYLNLGAHHSGIPLINGGSSLNTGDTMPYMPKKTSCIDCQMEHALSESVEEEKRSAGACFHPSIIISNQIVGALMVACYLKSLEGIFEKSTFCSGSGIFDQRIAYACYQDCPCRSEDG